MRQKQAHIIIVTKSVPKRFGNANSDKFTYYFLSSKAQMTFWQKHTIAKQHKPLKSLQKGKRTAQRRTAARQAGGCALSAEQRVWLLHRPWLKRNHCSTGSGVGAGNRTLRVQLGGNGRVQLCEQRADTQPRRPLRLLLYAEIETLAHL